MATGTAVDIVMPQMGVSVSEGTITKWLKAEGEAIAADEPLLEISTDKVDTEVPSPADGVLGRILAQEGETVPVGTVIAAILPVGTAAEAPATPAAEAPAEQVPAGAAAESASPPVVAPEPATQGAAAEVSAAAPVPTQPAPAAPEAPAPSEPEQDEDADGRGEGRAFVSPVVARIAAEHRVDVADVPGTGRGGRVTKKDILDFIEGGAAKPATAPEPQVAAPESQVATPEAPAVPPADAGPPPAAPPPEAPPPAPAAPRPPVDAPAPPAAEAAPPPAAPPPAAAPPPPVAAPPAQPPTAAPEPGAGEVYEPMTVMRKAIAEHMVRSVQTSAHVTAIFEVDMSKVVAIRDRLKGDYERKHAIRLTYLAFIARAVVDALQAWPRMNAEIRGDQIVVKQFVNLGIAVALDDGKGLIVPVIRSAEEKNLLGIARAIQDLAERARTKKLSPDEVQGGTFTITNPGGFGAIGGTPIINQPQVAIIDVEAIVKRPWVVSDERGNDTIAIRPIMNLCISYDHRLVDGAYAAPFMRDVRTNLETWEESSY
jgi:pyruvate/2-oxoglutarate dehydrogenase complex dihydrolipoamide acyltransferase (E2) component